ncbi:hypothetical protein STRTUCAR8_04957 [Streptomyces turgidiscabies Car8]|uniref:Response regulatory domain-containing protein n=1 Tax=Streptomyces turgidiscabies (strain Car8) TaxID=698760 RepID=L7FAL0_STRT8|nr:hypothetical protein STRTUCAR8_04957 [Streptomyces turgidiscabies Car8]GAQ75674.1 transcriptional regulatory protein LiaR [Streptomyces turgidiscabies]
MHLIRGAHRLRGMLLVRDSALQMASAGLPDRQERLGAGRAGFAAVVDAEEDLTVVGEAAEAGAAPLAVQLAPDVVIMDVRMPVFDGIVATRVIAGHQDAPRVTERRLALLSPGRRERGHDDVQEVRRAKASLAPFLLSVPFHVRPDRSCRRRRRHRGGGRTAQLDLARRHGSRTAGAASPQLTGPSGHFLSGRRFVRDAVAVKRQGAITQKGVAVV